MCKVVSANHQNNPNNNNNNNADYSKYIEDTKVKSVVD